MHGTWLPYIHAAGNNALAVEERARGNIALAGGFSDQRTTATSYTDIPERSISHTKLNGTDTLVRVTYFDTLGWSSLGLGQGCNWRLLVDGSGTAGTREFWSQGSYVTGCVAEGVARAKGEGRTGKGDRRTQRGERECRGRSKQE